MLEIRDHVLQLAQRDASNPLNERIDVRPDLGRAFWLAAQMPAILTDDLANCPINRKVKAARRALAGRRATRAHQVPPAPPVRKAPVATRAMTA